MNRPPQRVTKLGRALGVSAAVAIGLTAVALPAHATTVDDGDTAIGRIVALGDSYSSGLGIHADASDYDDHGPPAHSFSADTKLGGSTCHRELDTTPGAQLAAEIGAEADVVACAEAVIADVSNQLTAAEIADEGNGTLITITIGGNDLRTEARRDWPAVLIDCIISVRCDRSDDNQLANLDAMTADLAELYTEIGATYPDATVRVLGYPRLMQREWWGCPGVTGVGRREADWIDDQVDRLNDAIGDAVESAHEVTGAHIEFVSVEDEFDNGGACRYWQRDRLINDRVSGEVYNRTLDADGNVVDRFTDNWFSISRSSFHPGQAGYDAYYEALAASI